MLLTSAADPTPSCIDPVHYAANLIFLQISLSFSQEYEKEINRVKRVFTGKVCFQLILVNKKYQAKNSIAMFLIIHYLRSPFFKDLTILRQSYLLLVLSPVRSMSEFKYQGSFIFLVSLLVYFKSVPSKKMYSILLCPGCSLLTFSFLFLLLEGENHSFFQIYEHHNQIFSIIILLS